ncbi:MAG TPA: leucine--tRNA ligase [Chthonomonadaceae bacterium]|nr:leucine--tRNA ligase [Chthonomonadaceae bacterium]
MMSDDHNDNRYDFRTIEAKWQRRWEAANLFHVENNSDLPKFYGLDMFPYPSGAGISVGHCAKNYIPLDVACRHKVMQGYNVLHPMGWDAFGQPAENEAIKQGRNPREMVPEYAANYKRQLKLVGISYDWDREINSSSPDYYQWTQWIFLVLYKRGLAYRATTPINWCPSCKTGLANEEVVNGRCWRCGSLVEKRPMPQWYFRITAYADRLLEGLDRIQWPEGVKQMQREWIGRSEGAEVDFPIVFPEEGPAAEAEPETIRVFTTRPDTLWGATFMVLAPEHPLVDRLTTPEHRAEVAEYKEWVQRVSEIERQNVERAKTGVFTGSYAINPVNGEHIPIWIADYVLMGYGTGAIMAVPAHDQRDFEFARKFGIPIRLVYRIAEDQTEAAMTEALPAGGTMIAGPFAGAPNDKTTVNKVIRWLEEQGIGEGRINYRLRDWLISRQRYWGAPIPIVYCEKCGEVPVPEDQLPVELPDVESYQPTGTGESPLAAIPEFVNTTCPTCGGPAKRETDTMGGSACSSWYFLRFTDPHNAQAAFSQEAVRYWMPVDLYAGGAEHAVGHLLYARFWTKVLYDAGLVPVDEPFMRYRNQGMMLAYTPGREIRRDEAVTPGDEDDESDEPIENWKVLRPEERQTIPPDQWVWRWVKMSKSKGNVVTPDEMAEKYGADSLRLFGLFVAPFEETVQWTDKGIESAHNYLNRVWRIWTDLRPHYRPDWREALAGIGPFEQWPEAERSLRRTLHQTIRKVGDDIENFRFNTGVAALMKFTNDLSQFRNALGSKAPTDTQATLLSEVLETLTLLLSPITPHLADEFWERLGKEGFTYKQPWPQYNPEIAAEEAITIVVQVNGKLRDRLVVAAETPTAEVERLALESEKVRAELNGKQVRKVIAVPGKLVNVVIG